ncbi:MAG: heat-inducible transcriptional repressor HrcA [Chlamydiales bacterium]|nr:heat-inducible transcriptional repressor HrcA [Chlamydiales bacterium]
MKSLKLPTPPKSVKEARVYKVLFGLVAHYIQTGRAVGSHTLKDAGFQNLSSATLRNYFSQLEEEGFLHQLHSSGGRIPTDKAYRFYAQEVYSSGDWPTVPGVQLASPEQSQTREIARYLQETADVLSQYTNMAVFLTAPRFDHDYIIDIKVVTLDAHRCLVVLITEFGVIQTAILNSPEKLTSFSAKRLESYFLWRLTGHDKPENLEKTEERLAQEFYNEVMVRYIVRYSNFLDEDIFRTGFSKLLNYPEYNDVGALAASLALFEDTHSMRLLLREVASHKQMKFWIGDDIDLFKGASTPSAVVITPYRIHQTVAGSIGVLGPARIPYDKLFATLERFAQDISDTLTLSVYKFKISVRQPAAQMHPLSETGRLLLEQSGKILLEDKRSDA